VSAPPFLDTNIFVYAFGDDERTERAQEIISTPYVTSVQALNEFAHVVRRKLRLEWSEIRKGIAAIQKASARTILLDIALNQAAFDLAARYNLSFYDALMIAAALEAQSTLFLSEDLHHGLTINNTLTIQNPFR
jgi:predicted nucleic acid-binding protein